MRKHYDEFGMKPVDANSLVNWEKQLVRPIYDGDDDEDIGKEVCMFVFKFRWKFLLHWCT